MDRQDKPTRSETLSKPPPRDALLSVLRPPPQLSREDRVRLCGEFSEAALAGRAPSRDAMLFVAGAVSAWLARGGSLERDYLQVIVNGSHRTPNRVWRTLSSSFERTTAVESRHTVRPSSIKASRK